MRCILAIVACVLLATATAAVAQGKVVRVVSGPTPACPVLPGVNNVHISGEAGPDFWSCIATHSPSGKKLFDIYVGNHPPRPAAGFRYAGSTFAGGKSIVWFVQPTGGWGTPRIWQTFLPTGDDRLSIMVVSLTRTGIVDLDQITPLIAHLQVGP